MMTNKVNNKSDESDNNQLDEILRRNGSTLSSPLLLYTMGRDTGQDSQILLETKHTFDESEGSVYKDEKTSKEKEDERHGSELKLNRHDKLFCINGKYVVQGEINVNGIYGKIASTLSDNWHILEVLHQRSLHKLSSIDC